MHDALFNPQFFRVVLVVTAAIDCKQSSDSGELSDVATLLHKDPCPRKKVLL